MIDFTLHNSTTGELQCVHCGDIMFGHETARHGCEQTLDAWAEWAEKNLHDYD